MVFREGSTPLPDLPKPRDVAPAWRVPAQEHGAKGGVNVSASAWKRLEAHAQGRSLGLIAVKGKGEMEIFRVDLLRVP